MHILAFIIVLAAAAGFLWFLSVSGHLSGKPLPGKGLQYIFGCLCLCIWSTATLYLILT